MMSEVNPKPLPKYLSDSNTPLELELYAEGGGGGYISDRSSTCCGVLEFGGVIETGKDAGDFTVNEEEYEYCICGWRPTQNSWVGCGHPGRKVKRSKIPYEDKIKIFKKFEKLAKSDFGMITMYLLPMQDKGVIGQVVRELKYEYLGKFWNPKTRNTLHHYRKVLRSGPPRKRRKSKKAFAG